MKIFDGVFSPPIIRLFQKCPRALYFDAVLGRKPERVTAALLAGRAGREAVNFAHREQVWDPQALFEVFLDHLSREQEWARKRGLEVIDLDRVVTADYREMLQGYAIKKYNRRARVIALEQKFTFSLKPNKAVYRFSGRIDQVLALKTGLLRRHYPEALAGFEPAEVIVHRELSFGRRREVSPCDLALNTLISLKAYALKHGEFFTDESDDQPIPRNLIPDLHAVCFLRELIPPKAGRGRLRRDENGHAVPCGLVKTPCNISSGRQARYCQGRRAWCEHDPWRPGPEMFFTARTEAQLRLIGRDLGRVCASIRRGDYFARPGELCRRYCRFRDHCLQAEGAGLNEAA
ncbi:MAG: hypothetical protein V1742_05405 [Pseudomonadota bacterium]